MCRQNAQLLAGWSSDVSGKFQNERDFKIIAGGTDPRWQMATFLDQRWRTGSDTPFLAESLIHDYLLMYRYQAVDTEKRGLLISENLTIKSG